MSRQEVWVDLFKFFYKENPSKIIENAEECTDIFMKIYDKKFPSEQVEQICTKCGGSKMKFSDTGYECMNCYHSEKKEDP